MRELLKLVFAQELALVIQVEGPALVLRGGSEQGPCSGCGGLSASHSGESAFSSERKALFSAQGTGGGVPVVPPCHGAAEMSREAGSQHREVKPQSFFRATQLSDTAQATQSSPEPRRQPRSRHGECELFRCFLWWLRRLACVAGPLVPGQLRTRLGTQLAGLVIAFVPSFF